VTIDVGFSKVKTHYRTFPSQNASSVIVYMALMRFDVGK